MRWLLVGCVLLGCIGCPSLGAYLETREGRGCYRISGMYPPFVGVGGFLATGGETIASCRGESITPFPAREDAGVVQPASPSGKSRTCPCEE